MAIAKGRDGGIRIRSLLSRPLFGRLACTFHRAKRVSFWVRSALPIAVFSLVATGAFASPTRLLTASFSGSCDSYTFAVTGEGLDQLNPIVSYNIKLKARSGDTIIIVDSFAVRPEKGGSFHNDVRGFWKTFGYALTGRYTLSGSAILASNLTPLHTMPIAFSPSKINCGPDSGIRSLISELDPAWLRTGQPAILTRGQCPLMFGSLQAWRSDGLRHEESGDR